MKAVRVSEYGEPDVLQIDEIPVPATAVGEVLLKVVACGINPIDGWGRSGHLSARLPRTLPYTPGLDVVGKIVSDSGSDTATSSEIVLGVVSPMVDGGYAEYVAVPENQLSTLPEGMDPVVAASVMTPGITGTQLVDKALTLGPCKSLLILGALGSVGRAAIAEALHKGLNVSVVVLPGSKDEARGLGVANVLVGDGSAGAPVSEYDAVIDTVGPSLVAQWQNSLTADAVVQTIVPLPPAKLARDGIQTVPFSYNPNPEILSRVLQHVQAGRLAPPKIETVGLDRIRYAHERLFEKGAATKFVAVPNGASD